MFEYHVMGRAQACCGEVSDGQAAHRPAAAPRHATDTSERSVCVLFELATARPLSLCKRRAVRSCKGSIRRLLRTAPGHVIRWVRHCACCAVLRVRRARGEAKTAADMMGEDHQSRESSQRSASSCVYVIPRLLGSGRWSVRRPATAATPGAAPWATARAGSPRRARDAVRAHHIIASCMCCEL